MNKAVLIIKLKSFLVNSKKSAVYLTKNYKNIKLILEPCKKEMSKDA